MYRDGNNMKIKKYTPLGVGAMGLMALMQTASADVDESGKVDANETKGRLAPDYLVDEEIEDEAITSPNGGKVIEIKKPNYTTEPKGKLISNTPVAIGGLSMRDTRADIKDVDLGMKYTVDGGNDMVSKPYAGANTAVTKLSSKFDGYVASGTGTFISPNVILTVGHNYLQSGKDPSKWNKIADRTYYYNLGNTGDVSNSAGFPVNGQTVTIGDKNALSARFNHINQNKYVDVNYYKDNPDAKGSNVDWQYDFALTVVDTPMQFTSLANDADPLMLTKQARKYNVGETLRYAGYPQSFDEDDDGNNPQVTNKKIVKGNLLEVNTKVYKSFAEGDNGWTTTWKNTTLGGFSGSSLRNANDEVIGVLQFAADDPKSGYGGGLVFNQKALDWINKIVNENKVVGWRSYSGQKYYFQDNGKLFRNTTKVIDKHKWKFNSIGQATDLGEVKYGTVSVEYVDTEGNPILNGKVLANNVEEDTDFSYDVSKDPYAAKVNTNIWRLKKVQMNNKDIATNPAISGKVVPGKVVYKYVYEKVTSDIKVKYVGTGQEETLDNGGKGYEIGRKVKVSPKQIPGYHTDDKEVEITINKDNNVVEFHYKKVANVLIKYVGTGQEETLNNGGKGYIVGTKLKVKPKQIPGFWTKDTEREITIGENNVVEFKYTKDTDVTRLKQLIAEGNNTPKDMIESKYSSPSDKAVAEKLVKDIAIGNEIVKSPNDHPQEKVNDLVKTLEKDISDMVALRKKQQKLKDVEVLDNEGSEAMKKVRLKNRTEDSLRKYEEAKANFINSINTSVRNIKSGKLEETVTPALANLKKAISELKYKPIDKKEYEKVKAELNTELGEKLELEYLNDVYRNEYKKLTDDVNGLIAHVGRQLPEDLLQEEFDVEVEGLKAKIPEVKALKVKMKQFIEEEKVRRTIAEYVALSKEIRNFTLKVGSENKELLASLDGLAKKLDAGNRVLKDKSGVSELRKVIEDVRSGFNQVKESDKKTAETDSFNLTYGIRGNVNVTFTNSTPIGSVSSTGNVKDGKVSRVVNSRLGTVVDTRDTVTERPQDKQITVGTKNERRFVRYETKPYNVVGKGQVLVSGVTGLVEVWNINGEEVKFEVRAASDEVRG